MTIITKYTLREFTKIWILAATCFLVLFLFGDAVENINMAIKNDASFNDFALFILFRLPKWTVYLIPLSVLVSVLLTLALMSRNRELMVASASGISHLKLIRPLILVSFLFTLLTFFLNESIVPYCSLQANIIKRVKIEKREKVYFFRQNRIWFRKGNSIYNIRKIDPERAILYGISINQFDRNFTLIRRLDAALARWEKDGWKFYNIKIKKLNSSGEYEVKSLRNASIYFPFRPEDLSRMEVKGEQMNLIQLYKYADELRHEGYEARPYFIDFHDKIAFPFVCVIITIIGIPFTLRPVPSHNISMWIGLSLAIGIIYWFTRTLFISMGKTGVLPATISAWATNIIFLTAGLYHLQRVLKTR